MKKKHPFIKDNQDLQETEIHFEEDPQQDDFDRLMRASKVKKGFKSSKKNPPTLPLPKSDPVIFDNSYNQTSNARPLINKDKFDGLSFPKKQKARQRKIKLSPGFNPDSEIDLHGYTKDAALQRVEEFLQHSISKKLKTVLIITGRGLNSESKEGVLKRTVWNWLEINQTRFNLRFRWAPPFLGGKGAILIFWG